MALVTGPPCLTDSIHGQTDPTYLPTYLKLDNNLEFKGTKLFLVKKMSNILSQYSQQYLDTHYLVTAK